MRVVDFLQRKSIIISLIAIAAGVAANFVTGDLSGGGPLGVGPAAPFVLAVPCFAVCAVVVMTTWEENYGKQVSCMYFCYRLVRPRSESGQILER